MELQHVVYEPGKVARIIFNRPEQLNAQGFQLLEEVDLAFKRAVADDACGAIVLSGSGRAFSAGHDLGTREEIPARPGSQGSGKPGDAGHHPVDHGRL